MISVLEFLSNLKNLKMCEVTSENFKEKLSEIKTALENSKFIGIDLEFSALYPREKPSLFDSPSERYAKLRNNIEIVTPVQVGLTAFSFCPDRNFYTGKVFTFYVAPVAFPSLHGNFCFQTDSLSFLKMYKFDFNKFAYSGIPYLNNVQEAELRNKLDNNEIIDVHCTFKSELEDLAENEGNIVKEWYAKSKTGDFLELPNIAENYGNNIELIYFIHRYFRNRHKNLWTICDRNTFTIKKVTQREYETLEKRKNLNENLIMDLRGFSEVFTIMKNLNKPIVGHNLLYDLLIMVAKFETQLPKKYSDFKKLLNNIFPSIYDTKTITYEMRYEVPEEKRWTDSNLSTLFEYFKNGKGRHLALNSPAIEVEMEANTRAQYHEAGWDSFCAGYIFIRLAYLNIYKKYPSSKHFVSSELISGMARYKNIVNVIRGSVSHVKIDGEDPESSRPPWLIIESVKNKPVNISQAISLLSCYGFVEIKPLYFQKRRALVAVDNFGNARRIMNTFKSHSEFQVRQYSIFKHSPFIRTFLFSSITMTGAVLVWLTQFFMKR